MLKLEPRNNDSKNQAIDIFFTSLAQVHLNLAIGIVFSGNGNDGTQGLKAIQEYGGVTFAQDDSAANAGMPQNAITAGVVDFIMAPNQIPEKLSELLLNKAETSVKMSVGDEGVFQEIIQLLRQHSGVDFTYYKQTTIRRRMAMSKSQTLADYLKLLRSDKQAPEILFNDLLIPVTEFFRDTKTFQTIRETVFPIIAKQKSEANAIRIWVAGCSTGEEAYTLAISLYEFLGENLSGTQIQIFASDISELAIAKARIGFYTHAQLGNVGESILKKYFTKQGSGYQINRQIRDLCVFAVHNFLKDPPFAKMDLITCRNVLIYMDSFLQKKSLTTFHYALKPQGSLLLGKSETTAPAEELYIPFEKNEKIYTRKEASGRFVIRPWVIKRCRKVKKKYLPYLKPTLKEVPNCCCLLSLPRPA